MGGGSSSYFSTTLSTSSIHQPLPPSSSSSSSVANISPELSSKKKVSTNPNVNASLRSNHHSSYRKTGENVMLAPIIDDSVAGEFNDRTYELFQIDKNIEVKDDENGNGGDSNNHNNHSTTGKDKKRYRRSLGHQTYKDQHREYDQTLSNYATTTTGSHQLDWNITDSTTTSKLIDMKSPKTTPKTIALSKVILPTLYPTHDTTRTSQSSKNGKPNVPRPSSLPIGSKSHVSHSIILAPSLLPLPTPAIESSPDMIDDYLSSDELSSIYNNNNSNKKKTTDNKKIFLTQLSVGHGNTTVHMKKSTADEQPFDTFAAIHGVKKSTMDLVASKADMESTTYVLQSQAVQHITSHGMNVIATNLATSTVGAAAAASTTSVKTQHGLIALNQDTNNVGTVKEETLTTKGIKTTEIQTPSQVKTHTGIAIDVSSDSGSESDRESDHESHDVKIIREEYDLNNVSENDNDDDDDDDEEEENGDHSEEAGDVSVYDWIEQTVNLDTSRISTRQSESTPKTSRSKPGSFLNVLEAAGTSIMRGSRKSSADASDDDTMSASFRDGMDKIKSTPTRNTISSIFYSPGSNSSSNISPLKLEDPSKMMASTFSNHTKSSNHSNNTNRGSELLPHPASRPISGKSSIPTSSPNDPIAFTGTNITAAAVVVQSTVNNTTMISNVTNTQDNVNISTASTIIEPSNNNVNINNNIFGHVYSHQNTNNIVNSTSASIIFSPNNKSNTLPNTLSNIPINIPIHVPIQTNIHNFTVKETKDVKRNLVQLPRQMNHPKPTTGDWINKRYFVNNYILLDTLGKGSYGEVRLCRDRGYDQLYAMKIISKDMMKKKKNGNTSETYFEDIKREIAIMKKLLHPNVLRLYEVLDDPKVNKLYLVLEYMKKGDLITYLKEKDEAQVESHPTGSKAGGGTPSGDGNTGNRKGKTKIMLADVELWNIFRQVSSGIKYLHYQNVIHGDIKPQNLLVSDDGIVKIADFGISKMLNVSGQKLADAGGTPAFMSPELCSGESFSGQLADVWALGATMFMLRFGHPPFVAKTILNLYHKIQNDALVFPFPIDSSLQDLLSGMLEKDPNKRLTLHQVTSHPWLQSSPHRIHSTSQSNTRSSSHHIVSHTGTYITSGQESPERIGKLPPSALGTKSGMISLGSPTGSISGQGIGGILPIIGEDEKSIQKEHSNYNNSNLLSPVRFRLPSNYEHEHEAAMLSPIATVDENEIYQSIGLGHQVKETSSSSNSSGSGNGNRSDDSKSSNESSQHSMEENRNVLNMKALNHSKDNDEDENEDDLIETEENIMHTNWGDDVFQIVGENDVNAGSESDDDDDSSSDKDTVDGDNMIDNNTIENDVNNTTNLNYDMDENNNEKRDMLPNPTIKTASLSLVPSNKIGSTSIRYESGSNSNSAADQTLKSPILSKNVSSNSRQMPNHAISMLLSNNSVHQIIPITPMVSTANNGLPAIIPLNQKSALTNVAIKSTGSSANTSSETFVNTLSGKVELPKNINSNANISAHSSSTMDQEEEERRVKRFQNLISKKSAIRSFSSNSSHNSILLEHNHTNQSIYKGSKQLRSISPISPISPIYAKNSSKNSSRNSSTNNSAVNSSNDLLAMVLSPSHALVSSHSSTILVSRRSSKTSSIISQHNRSHGSSSIFPVIGSGGTNNISNSNINASNASPDGKTSVIAQGMSRKSSGDSVVSLEDETNELSMEAFATLMDTLAMQPKTDDSIPIDQTIDLTVPTFSHQYHILIYPNQYRNNSNRIACTYHTEQGHRGNQEDRCIIVRDVSEVMSRNNSSNNNGNRDSKDKCKGHNNDSHKISIGCIFDGHSGASCSQYLSEHFIPILTSHEKFLHPEGYRMEEVIKESCRIADDKVCKFLERHQDDSGSTGVIAVYNGNSHEFTVANVGDSICVLSQAGKAVKMNKMHRIDDKDEKERIIKSGGTVLNNRVNGVLAITRAFGDSAFKENNGQLGPIISIPDITTEIITPSTEFAILATDGLWDVMPPQAAVNFIRRELYAKVNIQEATKNLVVEAIADGSIDNVTVLVMVFNLPILE